MQSIPETKGCKTSTATVYEWNQPQLGRENTHQFKIYKDARVLERNKPSKLQDQNVTNVSTGSNTSEISRAMEKISETNQLLAQQQMVQQRALQALLHCQEQSSEVQEVSQKVQSQALVALTEVAKQRGFDPLFNKIAKNNGKDPEKCHYWLNEVSMACMESGRNFRQLLMFCAEDAVLTVLLGLNPALTNDQIREEIMMCFSLALTRRQALEKLRAMHQETDELQGPLFSAMVQGPYFYLCKVPFCLFLLGLCINIYIVQLWGMLRECTLGSSRVLCFYQHKNIYNYNTCSCCTS